MSHAIQDDLSPASLTTIAGLLSVVVPVSERHDDLGTLHDEYRNSLLPVQQDLEFIYVLDGPKPEALLQLRALRERGEKLLILQLGKWFGEAAAITAGYNVAKGDWILILPSYYQVEPASIPRLLEARNSQHMVVARRHPRTGSAWNRTLGRAFNSLVRLITGTELSDLGCGARLVQRIVLDEVSIYGDQHRFLPVIAEMRGFSVAEVPLAQSPRDFVHRKHRPGVFIRRILDLVSVFFLARFTKKPLRFFGLIGSSVTLVGGLWMAIMVFQRLFLDQPLAERPALILAALLVTLGVQIFTLGLVGEIIIFTHARDIREYAVEEIV
jgi:glycosyltransferase involved in cell wall biosynthesis